MKSKKLAALGKNVLIQSQINWLAEKSSIDSKENSLKLEFPDWHESKARRIGSQAESVEPNQLTYKELALNEVGCYAETARTLGIGKANIAIALTQLLNEYLTDGRSTRGLPPINNWADVIVVLRAIGIAEDSTELWAQAIGFDKIRELMVVDWDD